MSTGDRLLLATGLSTLAFLTLLHVILSGEARVAIKATGVVFGGSAMRVICKVPRHPDNRWLEIGIADADSDPPVPITRSLKQLDGEDTRVTWYFDVPHTPCETTTAYCLLTDNLNRTVIVSRPVNVSCSSSPSTDSR